MKQRFGDRLRICLGLILIVAPALAWFIAAAPGRITYGRSATHGQEAIKYLIALLSVAAGWIALGWIVTRSAGRRAANIPRPRLLPQPGTACIIVSIAGVLAFTLAYFASLAAIGVNWPPVSTPPDRTEIIRRRAEIIWSGRPSTEPRQYEATVLHGLGMDIYSVDVHSQDSKPRVTLYYEEYGWPWRFLCSPVEVGTARNASGFSGFPIRRSQAHWSTIHEQLINAHLFPAPFLANVLVYICGTMLLLNGPAALRWRRRLRLRQCPACGYDLRANASRRCPECGIDLAALDAAKKT